LAVVEGPGLEDRARIVPIEDVVFVEPISPVVAGFLDEDGDRALGRGKGLGRSGGSGARRRGRRRGLAVAYAGNREGREQEE